MAAFKGVLAAALLAAAVLATPAPAAASTKRPLPNCAAKKSETLLATKAARVYALRDDPSADAEIYACNYRKNRRVLLGYESECLNSDHVKGVRLAGRYVGYVTETCEIESENSTYDIQAVDLISGKTRRRAIAPSIADFEMSRTGSLVWFGWRTEGAGFEVRKLEPGSPPGGTLVDPGPDVAIGSLGLTNKGDGFYWRRGTTPQFGALR